MSDEAEREEYTEWGYRLADGRECWQQDYGTDGTWISAGINGGGIPVVDIYRDTDVPAEIRAALTTAGVSGTILKRKVIVTRGPGRGLEGKADHE